MDNLSGILRIRNVVILKMEDMRRLVGVKKSIHRRKDESLLAWYGHEERIADDRLVKKINSTTVDGTRRGRLRKRWINAVRE